MLTYTQYTYRDYSQSDPLADSGLRCFRCRQWYSPDVLRVHICPFNPDDSHKAMLVLCCHCIGLYQELVPQDVPLGCTRCRRVADIFGFRDIVFEYYQCKPKGFQDLNRLVGSSFPPKAIQLAEAVRRTMPGGAPIDVIRLLGYWFAEHCIRNPQLPAYTFNPDPFEFRPLSVWIDIENTL